MPKALHSRKPLPASQQNDLALEVLFALLADRERNSGVGRILDFIKRYKAPPTSIALHARSSICEDVITNRLGDLLSENPNRVFHVLDIACGQAVLPRCIQDGLGGRVERIAYWGIDKDSNSIEAVRTRSNDFRRFADFRLTIRDVSDLSGLPRRRFHIAVVNNALHEIAPRLYPKMFAQLNALLEQPFGEIYISDMESLSQPESEAILLLGAEVERFLAASGFVPRLFSYPQKRVPMFHIHMRSAAYRVDRKAMASEIERILLAKMGGIEAALRDLTKVSNMDESWLQKWLVSMGTAARCGEELAKLCTPRRYSKRMDQNQRERRCG